MKKTTTKAVVKRDTAKKVSTTTTLHPVIENLLLNKPLNKASKFNANHEWLELTSWYTRRDVDYSIYTCNEAEVKRRALEKVKFTETLWCDTERLIGDLMLKQRLSR